MTVVTIKERGTEVLLREEQKDNNGTERDDEITVRVMGVRCFTTVRRFQRGVEREEKSELQKRASLE